MYGSKGALMARLESSRWKDVQKVMQHLLQQRTFYLEPGLAVRGTSSK